MLAMLAFFILTTPPATEKAVKSRTFLFSYEASLPDLMEKDVARVWIPVPSSTLEQTVEIVALHLPGRSQLECERKYGNRVLYLELAGGANSESKIRIDYRIVRREVRTDDERPTAADEALCLKPDNKVPADGKHLKLLKRKELPENPKALSRALYDLVNSELRYSKLGTGWGQGDVNWVCDSKYGNCTDFHIFFIYPYVELNGEPYPSDKIERKFRYKDESAASSLK